MKLISYKDAVQAPFHFSLIAILFLAFFFHGCNFVKKNNIVTVNPDSYKLAKEGGDSLEMRQHVWQEADAFCRKKNQYFMPIAKNYTQNLYEMEFRCLNAGDPELLEGETPFQEKRYNKKLGGYGEVKY